MARQFVRGSEAVFRHREVWRDGRGRSGARGAGSDETQFGGDGFGGEIIRHALPEKYAALGGIEACLAQNFFEGLAIEINLHESQVGGFSFDELSQVLALGCEGLGMVNFEDLGGAKFGNAEGATIESGAEDDDLANAFGESGNQGIVNPARAGDSGGARAGNDHVGEPGDGAAEHGD